MLKQPMERMIRKLNVVRPLATFRMGRKCMLTSPLLVTILLLLICSLTTNYLTEFWVDYLFCCYIVKTCLLS